MFEAVAKELGDVRVILNNQDHLGIVALTDTLVSIKQ
jgi:hypothetical protein